MLLFLTAKVRRKNDIHKLFGIIRVIRVIRVLKESVELRKVIMLSWYSVCFDVHKNNQTAPTRKNLAGAVGCLLFN